MPPPSPYTGPPLDTANADRCDYLDGAVCLQPWPNDYFTVENPAYETGRRMDLNLLSMPQNAPAGLGLDVKPIDPTDHNRADGFSPGNLIVTKVPGLETQEAFDNSGLVSIDRPELYDDTDQPVVVINADTGERHPVWAEIDSNPADEADVNLIIRPLVNFDEGGRYVVALRNLRNDSDDPIEASNAFQVFRDNLTTENVAVENRREEMEELFEILGDSQIRRSELFLAWDFTVASERSLSSRMLSIRDRAFASLGGGGDTDLDDGEVEGESPSFTIDTVTDYMPAEDDRIARQVEGTMTVPCYLTTCAPVGGQFNIPAGPDADPAQNGTTTFTFICRIPRSSLGGPIATGLRPSLYGHGLLGSGSEVGGGNISAMAFEQQMMMCATDWYGFATQNIANIVAILQDLSLFPLLGDGSQQGFLHFLYLGRAMIHDDGFQDQAAFQDGGDSILDTSELYYDGNSQGGILGGSLTAVAPDFRRAVLGVPGMNYSTLLRRSVDFEPYAEGRFGEAIGGAAEDAICDQASNIPQPDLAAAVVAICLAGIGTLPDDTPLGLYDNYPDELERPLILSLMQMLWDRGEANGYAHHMTIGPAREHADARGPAAPRLRRPPGRERHRRGRGADDRRLRLPAGAGSRPPLGGRRLQPDLRHPRDSGLPLRRLGARLLGRRAARVRRPLRCGHGQRRDSDAAERQHPAAPRPGLRRRPAQLPAKRRQGACPEGRLPVAGGDGSQPLHHDQPARSSAAADRARDRDPDPVLRERIPRALARVGDAGQ